MAQSFRVVVRLAMSFVFMTVAAAAWADEDLTRDADFQKGLAIGAALVHQYSELGFGKVPTEADATVAAARTAGYVATFAYAGDDTARLSDLLGFTSQIQRAPDPGMNTRPYSLADVLVEWHWRKKVAAELRQRLN